MHVQAFPKCDVSFIPMQRYLIIAGLILLAVGAAWPWISKLPFGRLPGDIHIVRDGFSFHFPIVTCIVISVLLSIVFSIFRR
ncbi:MAG: hypothetical protein V7606_4214 [Burkholderiales bacterium]|jgi:hypothetical protein